MNSSRGEVFHEDFKQSAVSILKNAQAELEFDGPELRFGPSRTFASLLPFSAQPSRIPLGRFIFREGGRIEYCLEFTVPLLLLTAFAGVVGFFILLATGGSLILRLLIVLGLWGIMVFFIRLQCIFELQNLVDEILREIDGRRV